MLTETVHATAVAYNGRAVLISGASGSGKSSLALQLIALGCVLIADDQVCLKVDAGVLRASRPSGLPSLIEARGVGLLTAPMSEPAPVCLIVDMDQEEDQRLPKPRREQRMGVPLTLLRKVDAPHFPAAILLYLTDNAKQV